MPIADLHRLDIDSSKLKALSPRERYVFGLTGHVFNEIMTLQKLVIASRPSPDAHPFEQEGAVGNAVLFLKLLVGKTHEAMARLTRHSVAHILREKYFSGVEEIPDLQDRWDAAVARYEALTWIPKVRNTASFHYMSAGQWLDLTNDALCDDVHVIVGKRYAQTFFHWQDVLAALPMLRKVDEGEPMNGLGVMLEEMGEVTGALCECLANGLQAYMMRELTAPTALSEPVELPCDFIENNPIPYFYANR